MLSICIPIYNRGVINLASELKKQKDAISEKIEIICIDDASEILFKNINKDILTIADRYIELELNVGRAAIRNLFLNYVQNEYLLFLDADSLIIKKDFLKTYIDKLKLSEIDVVFGGRVYPSECFDTNRILRFKYGIFRESKSLQQRLLSPYLSFQTNNFLIRRDVLDMNRFNEQLKQYGHEDTLFALILKRNHINVEHIDNVVLNDELETNSEFLYKTEQAVQNLTILMKYLSPTEILDINLIRYSKRFHFFLNLSTFWGVYLMKFLRWYLSVYRFLNVPFLNLYKLLYFNMIYRTMKN
jgi:glycosyltransferase involved in cell wall biosynthesis